MEIEQLRKEFNQLLANISEHSERFTDHEHLPALEVSVMMSKINKLQEIATVLKFVLQDNEQKRKLVRSQESMAVPSKTIETPIEVEQPVIEPIENNIAEEQVQLEQQVVVDEQPQIQEPIKSTVQSKSSVSDKFSFAPLASLKDAFSLNDRYLFANELFKKDMSLFTETVKNIDACKDLMSAQEILNTSKTNLNWDTENERVISFYQLVERRFL